MRVVVYDDESLEAITVVNLPLTLKDMFERPAYRIPVMVQEATFVSDAPHVVDLVNEVTVRFETFIRVSPRHGKQRSVIAFTDATAMAMLLKPDYLPGQSPAVEYLQEQNDRLTEMLLGVIERLS